MASAQSSTKLKHRSKPVEVAAMAGVNEAAIKDATVAPAGVEEAKSKRGRHPLGLSAVIDRVVNMISSVPFGIVQLVLLIVACMIGMLIQQQDLDTFTTYYAELTPAEKIVYGRLGFFNIYHVWYFDFLLLLLSLNI